MSSCDIFTASRLPVLQNRTFATRDQALHSATGDLVLRQHDVTGLIHNAVFDPSKLSYDSDYQNEQACSSVFRRHLADVSAIIGRHFAGRPLLEIGCGKGFFLETLTASGFRVKGVDPAYEGTNPDILKAHFHRGLGLSADGIILRHVLEHIPDPVRFLADIAHANGGAGAIYIEVPCFDWIRRHRAWFDIFYEHVNYFRESDFARMFGRVHESGHVFGGQYLYAVADLGSLRDVMPRHDADVTLPGDFRSSLDRCAALVRTGRGRTAVWGAASKGVIFITHMQRAGAAIDEVIDINPVKQGRYLPVSGLKVSSPENAAARLTPGDTIFVMNSNYLDEIRELSGNRYSYIPVDHE